MAKVYTDGEIVTSFRQAKDKKAQLTILSQIQQCPTETLLDVIEAAGEDVSAYRTAGNRVEIVRGKHGARWTAEEDELLRVRISEGVSFADIATEIGCCDNAVYKRAAKLGFVPAGAGEESAPAPATKQHKWTEADTEALIELREDGMSSREIAEAIGCSRQNVDLRIARLKREGRIPDVYRKSGKKETMMKLKPAEEYAELVKVIRELSDVGAERVYKDVMSILTGDAEVGYYGEGSLPARIADNGAALSELEQRVEAIKYSAAGNEPDESPERAEVFSFPVEGGASCDPARWGFERRWNLALMLADMMGGDPREVRISSGEMLVEFGDVVFDVRFPGGGVCGR